MIQRESITARKTVGMTRAASIGAEGKPARERAYQPPPTWDEVNVRAMVARTGRGYPGTVDEISGAARDDLGERRLYLAGDAGLLTGRVVAVVGSRDASGPALDRAARLGRELAGAGATVMSGLARGVDTAALTTAMETGGRVVAVIGTPLSHVVPPENAALQEAIWRHHLLLSPVGEGDAQRRANFPLRNRVMAALSDATVIVAASDSSGTLHQARECLRLRRWLFVLRSVAEDHALAWPARVIGQGRVAAVEGVGEMLAALGW